MTASERVCCVPKCGNTCKDNAILHAFPNPHKDIDRYAAWIQAVGIDPLLDLGFVLKNRRVCHDHFEDKYIKRSRRLTSNAVPTMFLPVSKTAPIQPTEIANSPERSLLDNASPSTSPDSKTAQIPPTEITNGSERSLLDTTSPSTTKESLLRTKWKNQRSIFTREMKPSNAITIEGYNGQWQYFDTLKFLSDNIQMGTDDEQEQTVQINIKKEIPDSNSQTDLFVDKNNICNGNVQHPKPKKRRVADEDYDVIFLKSLTPYFKELDDVKKLAIKTKMQDLLLNEIAAQNST